MGKLNEDELDSWMEMAASQIILSSAETLDGGSLTCYNGRDIFRHFRMTSTQVTCDLTSVKTFVLHSKRILTDLDHGTQEFNYKHLPRILLIPRRQTFIDGSMTIQPPIDGIICMEFIVSFMH